jgi:hypothetical protein
MALPPIFSFKRVLKHFRVKEKVKRQIHKSGNEAESQLTSAETLKGKRNILMDASVVAA